MQAARRCMKMNGIFLTFDLTQFSFKQEAEALQQMCLMNGLLEKQVQAMQSRMQDDFYALSTHETFNLLREAGFVQVHSFTQVLSYQGFIAEY